MDKEIAPENRIVAFNDRSIRRVLHKNEWWYVVLDVIIALTDSINPNLYLKAMRRRDPEFNKGWV